jgi:CelD/BcsL family acetyltransferase involved in cellulose biosynthesis
MKVEFLDPFSPRVGEIWRTLEAQSRPPYFLTWGWVETWLSCLARDVAPPLAVLHADGPVAACFLGRRQLWRHGIIPSRALYLNATGVENIDDVCIEHNTVVGSSSLAALVAALPGDWDELFLPALARGAFDTLARSPLPAGCHLRLEREIPCHYVELGKVRDAGYIPLLGHRTRAQLRKALREAGDLTFEVARDAREATAIYDELVALHQHHWQSRGEPGAFADPWFERFHRTLIARRYAHGELHLMRLRSSAGTLGCTYNMIANGHVMFYQSGLVQPENRFIKPGFLCQLYAVEHYAKTAHEIYDFLGGDALYKKSLATAEMTLVQARIQRQRPWFLLEDGARKLRDALRRSPPSRTAAD